MKKLLFITVCLVLLNSLQKNYIQGQVNLVPNGSFEIFLNCPTSASQIYQVPTWYSPSGGTPDYFNGCAGSAIASAGVPLNWLGYQYAKTGVAYVGIFCYGATTGSSGGGKEYLQIQLTDTLVHENKYCISFYVNLAKTTYQVYNNVAITKMGIYISTDTVSISGTNTLPYNAQIESPPGIYLNDTVNWTLISGNYIAQGGEKYITIGNFNVVTDTIGVVNHNSYSASYYFIDDVSVVDCTTVGVGEAEESEEKVSISPNPFTSQTTLTFNEEQKNTTIKIMDILGKEIKTIHFTGKQYVIEKGEMNAGVYILQISSPSERKPEYKKLVVE